ncbi:MAG: Rap1a/Tai family immunity protein [Xanthobacteraceae bacterium]
MGDGPVYGWTACIPGGATGNQLKAISLRFFNEHMEIAQKGAAGIIAEALAQSFPCRK